VIAVIDTNVLLVSVSAKSKYHWLYQAILQKKIAIAFSNDILTEYEEVISSHWDTDASKTLSGHCLSCLPQNLPLLILNLILL
jgi:uncharacterized protein